MTDIKFNGVIPEKNYGDILVNSLDTLHSTFTEIGPHKSLAIIIQTMEQYLMVYKAIQKGELVTHVIEFDVIQKKIMGTYL